MKIIISRKGCDSGRNSGGMASPILPCGCLCSIPIPFKDGGIPYSDIRFGGHSLDRICLELNADWKHRLAHLDPDLRFDSLDRWKRPRAWAPAFGQAAASASHLTNQGVDKGDLFIFFGWFRETKLVGNRLQFSEDDKHGRHIVYGWLMVEEIFEVGGQGLPKHLQFLAEHAHTNFVKGNPNRIYIGTKDGAGVFSKVRPELVLTKPCSEKRSTWKLPSAFMSVYKRPSLTYHGRRERWSLDRGQVFLETVGRGQEFVLDCEKHPRVRDHFLNLIKSNRQVTTPCAHELQRRRMSFGSAQGEFTVPDDFNDPLPEDIEDLFYE